MPKTKKILFVCHNFYNLERYIRVGFSCSYGDRRIMYLWKQEKKEHTHTKTRKLYPNAQISMTKSSTHTKKYKYLLTHVFSFEIN